MSVMNPPEKNLKKNAPLCTALKWSMTYLANGLSKSDNLIFHVIRSCNGPFKYYVSKKVGGCGWPNTDVSKKLEKNIPSNM